MIEHWDGHGKEHVSGHPLRGDWIQVHARYCISPKLTTTTEAIVALMSEGKGHKKGGKKGRNGEGKGGKEWVPTSVVPRNFGKGFVAEDFQTVHTASTEPSFGHSSNHILLVR